MKKIIIIVSFYAIIFGQKSYGQNIPTDAEHVQLLTAYFGIKDALVKGSTEEAATSAGDFIQHTKTLAEKTIPENEKNALINDANVIAGSKDITKQRSAFAGLSDHMFALAKSVKLSSDPIYELYCPMKKAYWLSNQQMVKNPYFGNAMLSCGKVAETLQ